MVTITLPAPKTKGKTSLEETLATRRSIRTYRKEPLSLDEISQLLWAAQGITANGGLRTAPSAGALFPLETYLVAGAVTGLEPGIYRYIPHRNELMLIDAGDRRKALAQASFGQSWVAAAPATILFAARFDRITPRYGERGVQYTYLEAGHAAQNIYLQAVASKLGTVAIGAFDDREVKKVIGLSPNEQPIYFLPVGKTP